MLSSADNRLYDTACELLAAVEGFERAVEPGAASGQAAVLGCVEESLERLADALDMLAEMARPSGRVADADARELSWAVHDLAGELRRSRSTATRAREAANRAAAALDGRPLVADAARHVIGPLRKVRHRRG